MKRYLAGSIILNITLLSILLYVILKQNKISVSDHSMSAAGQTSSGIVGYDSAQSGDNPSKQNTSALGTEEGDKNLMEKFHEIARTSGGFGSEESMLWLATTIRTIPVDQAIDLVDSLPLGLSFKYGVNRLMDRLANEDMGTALNWYADIYEKPEYSECAFIFHQLGSKNFDELMNLGQTLPEAARLKLTKFGVAGLAEVNPERALKLLDTKEFIDSTGIPKHEFLNGIVAAISADKNAHIAAEYLGNAPDFQTAHTLVVNWSNYDAAAAASWISGLDDPSLKEDLVGGLVNRWAYLDPVAASVWINGLSEGRLRDLAASKLVENIAQSQPQEALAWAKKISDVELRKEIFKKIGASGE